MIRIDVIWVSVDVIWINVIQSYRIFAPNFFNFKIIRAAIVFENDVPFRVFNFTFFCAIPWRAPVREIRIPSIEEVEATDVDWWNSAVAILPKYNSSHFSTTLPTGNLWNYTLNGSWWFHTNAVIRVLPKINTCFLTNIPTPKGDFLITMSPSINVSANLVSINERVIRSRSNFRELFRPFKYIQQQDMFHPSVVRVFRLIRRQFPSCIFP